jgi:hypothetical protein
MGNQMVAARRHLAGTSAGHVVALGLILGVAVAGVAPVAFADSPPGTSTDQTTTVSEPTTDVTPAPDPAPPKTTAPPPVHHSVSPTKKAAPDPTTAPERPVARTTPSEPARTVIPTRAVQPSGAQSTQTATPPTAAITPQVIPTHRRKAPAKPHPSPSSLLERPPTSPAVEHKSDGTSAQAGIVAHGTRPHASIQNEASQVKPNGIARDFVLVLDAVAVVLLLLAWTPLGVLQRRFATPRATRFRPTLAAAGISLLSASLILFMLNLSGPVP